MKEVYILFEDGFLYKCICVPVLKWQQPPIYYVPTDISSAHGKKKLKIIITYK
jgi:hypothetical protein